LGGIIHFVPKDSNYSSVSNRPVFLCKIAILPFLPFAEEFMTKNSKNRQSNNHPQGGETRMFLEIIA